MVLLGGLEFVAAGYLLNERNKLQRESARRQADQDLRARGFRPEGMEEQAAKRNEEILLHRRETGLLGPPMVATPGVRPLSAPGFVERPMKQDGQQGQHYPQQPQYPQQQYLQPPQYPPHHHHPHSQPGFMPHGQPPPQNAFPPHMQQYYQNPQGPTTPPPAYTPTIPQGAYAPSAPQMPAYPRERDEYARERNGWHGHGGGY